MIKIAFYGKSGSGKSTIANETKNYFNGLNKTIEVIKFAEPLYYLQNEFYKIAGTTINYYDQNQKLLENIAEHLRRINSKCLANQFNEKLIKSKADVIINDDVRDIADDFPYLKSKQFFLIRISCEEDIRLARLKKRNDINSITKSKTTQDIETVEYDYLIDNSNSNFEYTKLVLKRYLDEIVKSCEQM